MPRVLITGGAGFIGQTLARVLLERGFNVRTFDMFRPAEPVGEHIVGTIMYPDEIGKAAHGSELVVHLAAMLGVKRTEEQRLRCLDININGTKNVLDACVSAGVKKIVFASSSEVYGEPVRTMIGEDDPVSPKSVYGVTKLAGEEFVKAYHQRHGLDYTIVRFFNVYGPGQVAEFVIPKFIRAIQDGMPLVINGDGTQVRSFCYVDDAALGVALALENERANAEIFNIGNDQAAVTILELAKKVLAQLGHSQEIRFVKNTWLDRTNAREISKRIPDISKAKTILGYRPVVLLPEGIRRTVSSNNIPHSWPTREEGA